VVACCSKRAFTAANVSPMWNNRWVRDSWCPRRFFLRNVVCAAGDGGRVEQPHSNLRRPFRRAVPPRAHQLHKRCVRGDLLTNQQFPSSLQSRSLGARRSSSTWLCRCADLCSCAFSSQTRATAQRVRPHVDCGLFIEPHQLGMVSHHRMERVVELGRGFDWCGVHRSIHHGRMGGFLFGNHVTMRKDYLERAGFYSCSSSNAHTNHSKLSPTPVFVTSWLVLVLRAARGAGRIRVGWCGALPQALGMKTFARFGYESRDPASFAIRLNL